MRIHLRVDHQDPGHTHFAVFYNGGKAGDLVLRTDEFENFVNLLESGAVITKEVIEVKKPSVAQSG